MKMTDIHASHVLLAEALTKKGYRVTKHETRAAIMRLESPDGKRWEKPEGFVVYPFNSSDVIHTALHKNLTYELTSTAGFSAPRTFLVGNEISDQKLLSILDECEEVIVKPNNKSLSKGLTLKVHTLDELKKALVYAKEFSPTVLIQRQVYGEEIRFTVLDGKVVAALLRQTARVIGDGVTSIAELIVRENKQRELLHFKYLSYPQLDESLVDSYFIKSGKVPAKGEIVELSHSTMIKGGCSVYDVLDKVHESYIARIEKLVNALGANFIVADIFCSDYTKPAHSDNHWLIEFNTAPVLKMYYSCRYGRQFDAVARIVESIDGRMQNQVIDLA